jgi:hypothetical protein
VKKKRKDPSRAAADGAKADFAIFILEILLYVPRLAGRFIRNL